MSIDSEEWSKLERAKIAAIEFNPSDRWYLLEAIDLYCPQRPIYYYNAGYDYLQQYREKRLISTDYRMGQNPIRIYRQVQHSAVFIFEGWGKIDEQLSFELRNFFFEPQQQQIFVADSQLDIPLDLFSMVQRVRLSIPLSQEISFMLKDKDLEDDRKNLQTLNSLIKA